MYVYNTTKKQIVSVDTRMGSDAINLVAENDTHGEWGIWDELRNSWTDNDLIVDDVDIDRYDVPFVMDQENIDWWTNYCDDYAKAENMRIKLSNHDQSGDFDQYIIGQITGVEFNDLPGAIIGACESWTNRLNTQKQDWN